MDATIIWKWSQNFTKNSNSKWLGIEILYALGRYFHSKNEKKKHLLIFSSVFDCFSSLSISESLSVHPTDSNVTKLSQNNFMNWYNKNKNPLANQFPFRLVLATFLLLCWMQNIYYCQLFAHFMLLLLMSFLFSSGFHCFYFNLALCARVWVSVLFPVG